MCWYQKRFYLLSAQSSIDRYWIRYLDTSGCYFQSFLTCASKLLKYLIVWELSMMLYVLHFQQKNHQLRTTTLITTRGILSVYSLVTNKIEIGIYELLSYFLFSVVKLHLSLIEELNSELRVYSEKQLAIVENYTVVTGVSRPTSSRFATSNILVLVDIDLWENIKIKTEVGIQISNCLPRLTKKTNNMQGALHLLKLLTGTVLIFSNLKTWNLGIKPAG